MDRNQIERLLEDWENRMRNKQGVMLVWNEINDIIKWLENNTGRGLLDDPFKNLNDTLFRRLSLDLGSFPDQKQLAINSLKRYYEKCLGLELEYHQRMHKAETLFWIGRFYYELRMLEEAFHYWILTFLDDVLSEFYKTADANGHLCIPDSLRAPVCELLQLYFDVPIINLQNLRSRSIVLLERGGEHVLNPEELMFKLRNAGHQTPRLVDYQSYHPHISYLRSIHDEATRTNDPKLWEQFAAFLLSSIDGLEPITNIRVGGGSYEFDVVVRNFSKSELFTGKLGDYIGVECKYLEQREVSVEQLDHFASKLKYHDMKCGIVFSRTPSRDGKATRASSMANWCKRRSSTGTVSSFSTFMTVT